MQVYKEFIFNWLLEISERELFSKSITALIVGLTLVAISLISFHVSRKIIVSFFRRLSLKTTSIWDDILIKHKFFHGIAHLIPASIFYFEASYANDLIPSLAVYILKFSNIYFLFAFIILIISFINSLNEIYNTSTESAKERPISGAVQFLKIAVYFISFLIFLSILFDKPLGGLLTGLGALAAILVLVFKDSLLGLIASVQITMNDMVKIGDWIEMPSKLANGTVTEINLTTVKVQNGDKTITNIPIYSLISDSFINWKGLEQAGVRRIKRWVNIDMNSVKLCDDRMLEKFMNISQLKDSIIEMRNEFNSDLNNEDINQFNGKNQTNLGIFRKYLESYLNNNPMIDKEMSIVVRHLQPTENGIPIEVNVFCKEIQWPQYEAIQSDIFDHILAIIPEFELRVFQNPSGADMNRLISRPTLQNDVV